MVSSKWSSSCWDVARRRVSQTIRRGPRRWRGRSSGSTRRSSGCSRSVQFRAIRSPPLLSVYSCAALAGRFRLSAMHRSLRVCAVLAIAATAVLRPHAQESRFDLIIRRGHVVDGTGNPWIAADVGIRADRIAAVGNLAAATAGREIDARGLVVAPGFIDMHTHSDLTLLDDGNAESKVREGVTLDVIGESTSVAPRDGLPVA